MTIPTIHLEIEGMRYQVLHALTLRNQETEEAVAAALDEVIGRFDFRAEVIRIAEAALRDQITKSVTDALWNIFHDKNIQAAVRNAIESMLLKPAGDA